LATEFLRIADRGRAVLQYRCPSCGYVVPHWAFPEVEPPDGSDGSAMSEQKPRPSERKYRACPVCAVARAASELPRARTPGTPVSTWGKVRWACCPTCGHMGPLATVAVVELPEGGGRASSPRRDP
jgi:hypothetical protein